jgi:predicted site-specific integrase-resolvase
MAMKAQKPLGPIDPLRRYSVEQALELLGVSRKKLYDDIKAGRIATIGEGRTHARTARNGREYLRSGRRFIPASEIIRLSRVPAPEAHAA